MAKAPEAKIKVSVESKGAENKIKDLRKEFEKAGGEFRSGVFGGGPGRTEKKHGRSAAAGEFAGDLVQSGLAMGGQFLINQGKEVYDFNDRLERLRILSGESRYEIEQFGKSVRVASSKVGINELQVLDAGRAYVTLTGDMETAKKKALEWGMVAQATESNADDIAKTAAAMKQNLKIDPRDMMAGFGILNEQGKKGAIELKDLSQELANIAPQWAIFKGGSGLNGLKEMGAALQIVKKGFGGEASETVTGVQSLLTSFLKNAKNFRKAGIKIFDVDKNGVKTMKSVYDIIDGIMKSKLVNDPAKLEKAFGRVEAYRAYLQLSENNEELKKLSKNAGGAADIMRDFNEYMSSGAGKAKQDWTTVMNQIKETFTPERIEVFVKALTGIIKSLGFVADKLGGVLSIAESIGKGAAMVFGGDSEEDRIAKLQAKRIDERRAALSKKYDAKYGESDKEKFARTGVTVSMHKDAFGNEQPYVYRSPGGAAKGDEWQSAERKKYIDDNIRSEEDIKGRLQTQIRGGTISRPFGDAAKGTFRDLGNYSAPELMKLREMAKGSSDDAMMQELFTAAITKAITAAGPGLTGLLTLALQHRPPVEVQVNGDTVAKTAGKAPRNRKRPGG